MSHRDARYLPASEHQIRSRRLPERRCSQSSQRQLYQSRAPSLLRFTSFAVACCQYRFQFQKASSSFHIGRNLPSSLSPFTASEVRSAAKSLPRLGPEHSNDLSHAPSTDRAHIALLRALNAAAHVSTIEEQRINFLPIANLAHSCLLISNLPVRDTLTPSFAILKATHVFVACALLNERALAMAFIVLPLAFVDVPHSGMSFCHWRRPCRS